MIDDISDTVGLFEKGFSITEASSDSGKDELIKLASSINKKAEGFDTIVLLNEKTKDDPFKIIFSYINAAVSFKYKMNKANELPMEMMLYLGDNKDISSNLREFGIEDTGKFIIFSTSDKILKSFCDEAKVRKMNTIRIPDRLTKFDIDKISNISRKRLRH